MIADLPDFVDSAPVEIDRLKKTELPIIKAQYESAKLSIAELCRVPRRRQSGKSRQLTYQCIIDLACEHKWKRLTTLTDLCPQELRKRRQDVAGSKEHVLRIKAEAATRQEATKKAKDAAPDFIKAYLASIASNRWPVVGSECRAFSRNIGYAIMPARPKRLPGFRGGEKKL